MRTKNFYEGAFLFLLAHHQPEDADGEEPAEGAESEEGAADGEGGGGGGHEEEALQRRHGGQGGRVATASLNALPIWMTTSTG